MSDLKSGDFGYVCSHGNLERKCEICEKDTEIAKLKKELEETQLSLLHWEENSDRLISLLENHQALKEEHCGDCTDECHSCERCQVENCLKRYGPLASKYIKKIFDKLDERDLLRSKIAALEKELAEKNAALHAKSVLLEGTAAEVEDLRDEKTALEAEMGEQSCDMSFHIAMDAQTIAALESKLKSAVVLKVKRTCPVCWQDNCVGVCEEDFARAKHEISALESKLKSAEETLEKIADLFRTERRRGI